MDSPQGFRTFEETSIKSRRNSSKRARKSRKPKRSGRKSRKPKRSGRKSVESSSSESSESSNESHPFGFSSVRIKIISK